MMMMTMMIMVTGPLSCSCAPQAHTVRWPPTLNDLQSFIGFASTMSPYLCLAEERIALYLLCEVTKRRSGELICGEGKGWFAPMRYEGPWSR